MDDAGVETRYPGRDAARSADQSFCGPRDRSHPADRDHVAHGDRVRLLTVRQPWATWIVQGLKPTENRTWSTSYRGPLLIHAGLSRAALLDLPDELRELLPAGELVYGAIIGSVELYDCVRLDQIPMDRPMDRWATGPWCWLLRNPQPLARPIPWTGRLGLTEVPAMSDRPQWLVSTGLGLKNHSVHTTLDEAMRCVHDRIVRSTKHGMRFTVQTGDDDGNDDGTATLVSWSAPTRPMNDNDISEKVAAGEIDARTARDWKKIRPHITDVEQTAEFYNFVVDPVDCVSICRLDRHWQYLARAGVLNDVRARFEELEKMILNFRG